MILLVLCRILRIAPRRHCLACGEETMKAYAPLRHAVLRPLGLGLRSCRACRRRWLAPAAGRRHSFADAVPASLRVRAPEGPGSA